MPVSADLEPSVPGRESTGNDCLSLEYNNGGNRKSETDYRSDLQG